MSCWGNRTSVSGFLLTGFQDLLSFKIPLFIILLLLYTITIIANLLIMVLVCGSHLMESAMYFFLVHLSACDLIFITNIVPNMLHVTLKGGSLVSFSGCFTQVCICGLCTTSECYLLSMMSYDRYLAIHKPLHYKAIMGLDLCLHLVNWSWSISLLFAILTVTLISKLEFCEHNVIDHIYCDVIPILELSCSDTSAVKIEIFLLTIVIVLAPFVFVIVTYIYILITILAMSSTSGRQKAFSTCSSHLAVVCSYYGSLISIYLTPSGGRNFNLNKVLSLLYTVITPLFNPVIYSLRNQEIRKVFDVCVRGASTYKLQL